MRVAFIGEGNIDEVLIPPLITTLAKTNHINWPIDFSNDIRRPFGRGFGGVTSTVRDIIAALKVAPVTIKKQYQYFIVLIDGRGTSVSQAEIQKMIEGHEEFVYGIAIKEVEAWVLADRDHLIEWLGIEKKGFPTCRFWDNGYQPESDPDPKRTLSELLQASEHEFDVWCVGAAEDFIEKYCKGTDFTDARINMDNWQGNANLLLMAQKCPKGFRPFKEAILRMLGKK